MANRSTSFNLCFLIGWTFFLFEVGPSLFKFLLLAPLRLGGGLLGFFNLIFSLEIFLISSFSFNFSSSVNISLSGINSSKPFIRLSYSFELNNFVNKSILLDIF